MNGEGRSPIALVARREVREQFRSKYYRGSLIVQVLLVAAAVIIASLTSSGGADTFKVAVVQGDPAGTAIATEAGELAGTEDAKVEISGADDRAAAEAVVSDGDVDAALDGRTLITQPDSDETPRRAAASG